MKTYGKTGAGSEPGKFGSGAKTTAGDPNRKGSKPPTNSGSAKYTSAKTDQGMKGSK